MCEVWGVAMVCRPYARVTWQSGRCRDGVQQDLYQATEGWRRPSLETTQHSEFFQQVLEANKDADGPCDFVCRVTDILSTTSVCVCVCVCVCVVCVCVCVYVCVHMCV